MDKNDIWQFHRPEPNHTVKTIHIHSAQNYQVVKDLARKKNISMSNLISNLIRYAISEVDNQTTLESSTQQPSWLSLTNADLRQYLDSATPDEIKQVEIWLNDKLRMYNAWYNQNTHKIKR